MFVVYSPEGQSYLGMQNTLPPLQVPKAQPVPPVEKPTLDPLQVEQDRRYQQVPLSVEQARRQYEQVLKAARERGETIIQVREIMSQPVVQIEPKAPLQMAWERMQQHGIGHLVVVQEGKVIGLLSSQDLLGHVWEEGGQTRVKRAAVDDHMSSPVVTCWPETLIRRAAQVMTDYVIHALPVVTQNGELVGIVTASDMIRRLAMEPPLELYV